jgi:hypothetical protein
LPDHKEHCLNMHETYRNRHLRPICHVDGKEKSQVSSLRGFTKDPVSKDFRRGGLYFTPARMVTGIQPSGGRKARPYEVLLFCVSGRYVLDVSGIFM